MPRTFDELGAAGNSRRVFGGGQRARRVLRGDYMTSTRLRVATPCGGRKWCEWCALGSVYCAASERTVDETGAPERCVLP